MRMCTLRISELLPPGFGLHAKGQAIVVADLDRLAGGVVLVAVPHGVGGEHADLRTGPEAAAGRPLLGQGDLLQVDGVGAIGLRIDLVIAELQGGAHHVVPLVDGTHAQGQPFLAGVVVEVFVLVDLHVHHFDVVAERHDALVDQALHVAVAVAGAVAPAGADDAVGAVLQGEFIEAAEPVALDVLHGEQVTFLVLVARVLFLQIGQVGLAEVVAELQLAVGVEGDVVEAEVEGVVGHVGACSGSLVDPVAIGVAHPGDVRLGKTQVDVLDTGAGAGDIPVVVVVDVHVMALVVALAGPQGGARQHAQDVLALHVELADRAGAVAERIVFAIGGFPVVLLAGDVGDHAVDVEALLAFLPDFLAQADLRIGLALVAQAVLGRGASGLETGLVAAASGRTNTGTQVTVEIHGQGWRRQQHGNEQGAGPEQLCRLDLLHRGTFFVFGFRAAGALRTARSGICRRGGCPRWRDDTRPAGSTAPGGTEGGGWAKRHGSATRATSSSAIFFKAECLGRSAVESGRGWGEVLTTPAIYAAKKFPGEVWRWCAQRQAGAAEQTQASARATHPL